MNLLTQPIITVERHRNRSNADPKLSLPGLLATLCRGEIRGFPELRPHQRGPWHMLLVQLGALAAWTQGWPALAHEAHSEAEWTRALRSLTPSDTDDAPWCLTTSDGKRPAFLQPPEPTGAGATRLKWSTVPAADALDCPKAAKNHNTKQQRASKGSPEHWLFALMTLQTSEGYGGRANYGIARMNAGYSSRPMLALIPKTAKCTTIDPCAWWRRDVEALLALRGRSEEDTFGRRGGPALLWCLEWDEGEQLDPHALDPWFIEICRRIRLKTNDGTLSARRSTSKTPRIDAATLKGNVNDPWAPTHATEGKTFTLNHKTSYRYDTLSELLLSDTWRPPLLATPQHAETQPMLLLAEGLCRNEGKTEGLHSRIVEIPAHLITHHRKEACDLSKHQIEEIAHVDGALRDALHLAAARGDRKALRKEHINLTKPAREQLARVADELFFPSLWHRVQTAIDADHEAQRTTRQAFVSKLAQAAWLAFERALPSMPCTTSHRPRARIRARRLLKDRLGRRPEATTHRAATAIWTKPAQEAAAVVKRMDAATLASCRRTSAHPSAAAILRRIAAHHPLAIRHAEEQWMTIIRILALLTTRDGPPRAKRRLGTVLCDGGNVAWHGIPATSEHEMMHLMTARGRQRDTCLLRLAQRIARRKAQGVGIDAADIATALLQPENTRLLAEPYYDRLDAVGDTHDDDNEEIIECHQRDKSRSAS